SELPTETAEECQNVRQQNWPTQHFSRLKCPVAAQGSDYKIGNGKEEDIQQNKSEQANQDALDVDHSFQADLFRVFFLCLPCSRFHFASRRSISSFGTAITARKRLSIF